MRQNKKDIPIRGLNEKKLQKAWKDKDLEDSHSRCKVLIEKHERLIRTQKFKTVSVPNDPFNTKYLIKEGKDAQTVINRYKHSRKY